MGMVNVKFRFKVVYLKEIKLIYKEGRYIFQEISLFS